MACAQVYDQVQAGTLAENNGVLAEVMCQRFHESSPAPVIQCPHSTEVPLEKALDDEVSQYMLFQSWRLPVHQPSGLGDILRKSLRNDYVSESQRPKEHLRTSTDVEHSLGSAQPLQRRDRTAAETKLAVIVVFHDICPARFGPREQLEA